MDVGGVMGTIVKNVSIVTGQAEAPFIRHGYFKFADGVIVSVAEGTPSPEEIDRVEVIDGKGKWVMPGMINTHGHLGMSLLRGHSDDLPLQSWLTEKMWPFEGKMDREAVHHARQLAMAEMIKSGTTTFLEMYHLYMDDLAEAVVEQGPRAVLMRSMIGLCSESEQREKLKEAVTFATTWNGDGNGRITTMMAPHAPYTCPPSFIEMIVDEADRIDLPLHTHMAETQREVEEHRKTYGVHPLVHFEQLGFLKDRHWLLAHCVHLGEEELDILEQHPSVHVSHNPMSNLKLGSGIANVQSMLERGINICLGTDSVASNNHLDLVEEMRIAALLQKGAVLDPTAVPAETAIAMATKNGAKALRLPQVGTIEAGKRADFIMIDPQCLHLQPHEHVMSHLVYALKGADVQDVFVEGAPLMLNKELKTFDEEKLQFEANAHYQRICEKLK
jgi:5-methylthioadenosine/S-adenosylhomocysteine deaminase